VKGTRLKNGGIFFELCRNPGEGVKKGSCGLRLNKRHILRSKSNEGYNERWKIVSLLSRINGITVKSSGHTHDHQEQGAKTITPHQEKKNTGSTHEFVKVNIVPSATDKRGCGRRLTNVLTEGQGRVIPREETNISAPVFSSSKGETSTLMQQSKRSWPPPDQREDRSATTWDREGKRTNW